MTAAGEPINILVVEDEWLLRADIAEQLNAAGCHVLEAARGEEAVALLQQESVDLVVTDIHLAGRLSGWDVARAAREADPGIPVIYASAYASDDSRRVHHSLFLTKPYSLSDLLEGCRTLSNDLGRRFAGPP